MMKLNPISLITGKAQYRLAAGFLCPLIRLVAFILSASAAMGQSGSSTNTAALLPINASPAGHHWPQNRYVCFSNMAVLPPIQLSADAKMILVGNFGHFRLRGLPTLSSQDAKIVAGELGVPTGLVIRVANLSGGNPDRRADEIVGLLRVAVIDFRFLLAELTSYQPGTDGEPAKRAALSDLLEGNLPSVWCFYRELPWPEPPSGLRVVGSR